MAVFSKAPKPKCDFNVLFRFFQDANGDETCADTVGAKAFVEKFLKKYDCRINNFTVNAAFALQQAETGVSASRQIRGKIVFALLHRLR